MKLLNPGLAGLDWKTHVKAQPETAQVLDRMIEPLIRERYQSAAEVHRDLQTLRKKLATNRPPAPSKLPSPSQNDSPQNPSQNQTTSPSFFDPQFLTLCKDALASHVGPMASFLLDEKLAQQAEPNPIRFIEALTDEIPDPDAAAAFRKKLLQSNFQLTPPKATTNSDTSLLDSALFPASQLPRVVLSRTELDKLVKQMRSEGGLEIKDRRHSLKIYPQCFVGKDAISWLKTKRALDIESAVYVYQQLIEMNVIHHGHDSHSFKNEKLFYRFYVDEKPREF